MARTQVKKRRSYQTKNSKPLSDKAQRFCAEYAIDLNATQAAIRAGFSPKSAQAQSSQLLADPRVQAEVGVIKRKANEKSELNIATVLEQIHSCLTREGTDFIDKSTGELVPIHQLPKRANQAIDGIEQEVTTIERENMPPMKIVKTKLKLVSKSSMADMAMKHLGAYAAEKHLNVTRIVLDLDELSQPNPQDDVVEARISAMESKRLESK